VRKREGGTVTEYELDMAGRILVAKYSKDGKEVARDRNEYDPRGRLVKSEGHNSNGAWVTTATYDDQDRILFREHRASYATTTDRYTYSSDDRWTYVTEYRYFKGTHYNADGSTTTTCHYERAARRTIARCDGTNGPYTTTSEIDELGRPLRFVEEVSGRIPSRRETVWEY
jgi:YD repeat-containing protein